MTPTECVRLCRFIAARCPAMTMQDETPEAWYLDLVSYDLPDALEAARRATLDKTYIGIGDLVRECQTIVRQREGQQRQAQLEAQIAAENTAPAGALQARPLRALLAGTPLKPMPRTDRWSQPAVPVASKPPLTDAELAEARQLLAAAVNDRRNHA